MPVEIIETKYGYYIPMDGPWDSAEDKEAHESAKGLYKECVDGGNKYVCLIRSHHEYSHGYWIETRKDRNVKYPDLLLEEHENNTQ